MESPIKVDDLGGTTIFGNIHVKRAFSFDVFNDIRLPSTLGSTIQV